MIHVAILKPEYIRDILAGRKTIESRFTKTNQPPYGRIEAGERLFLKASGGPFMATALASNVQSWPDLTPPRMREIEKRFRAAIGGDDAYWQSKRDSRFATLIKLGDVQPINAGPAYKVAYMKAWYVLDEALSPVRDYVITGGAIRNRYACIPGAAKSKKLSTCKISLTLPDGETVVTQLARGNMLHWRGWGPVYDAANAEPGDRVRFIAISKACYRVELLRRSAH